MVGRRTDHQQARSAWPLRIVTAFSWANQTHENFPGELWNVQQVESIAVGKHSWYAILRSHWSEVVTRTFFFLDVLSSAFRQGRPKINIYMNMYVCMYVYIKISNYLFSPPSVNIGVLMALDQWHLARVYSLSLHCINVNSRFLSF